MRNPKRAFRAPASGFKLPPVHPGLTLAEEIELRGLSANALALKLHMPGNRVVEIINGNYGVSAEMALRLGRYLGTGAQFWMNLQSQYDLALAERDMGAAIEKEVEALATAPRVTISPATHSLSPARIKAALAVWFEAIYVQHERLAYAMKQSETSHSMRFDVVFLLEALCKATSWLRHAKEAGLVIPDEFAQIGTFAPIVMDLRNMNIHQDDYLQNKGRAQDRFAAATPFGHEADSSIITGGQLVAGGRLNVQSCVAAYLALGKALRKRGFWPGQRAPECLAG